MKSKLFLVFLMLFVIPTIASADSISVTCSSTSIKVNESTNCTIKGTTSSAVSSLSSKLSSSGNIKISNITTSSIWQGNGDGGSIDLYTDVNKTGTFAIGTFKVTATATSGTGSVSLANTKFYDANFTEKSVANVTLNIKVNEQTAPSNPGTSTNPSNPGTSTNPSNPPTVVEKPKLKSLSITPGTINFQSNVFEYSVTVPSDTSEVSIKATAADSNSKVSIPADLKLKGETTTFNIVLTSSNKQTQTYKIIVKKSLVVKSSDASLKSLLVDGVSVQFDKNLEYTLSTTSDSLNMNVTLNDEKASFNVYGNNNLNNEDVVLIKVTAEDGTMKCYTILINKDNEEIVNGSNVNIPTYVFVIAEVLWVLLLLIYFSKLV